MKLLRPAIAALLLLAAGCAKPPEAVHQRFLVFGMWIDVTLWDVAPERAGELVAGVESIFQTRYGEWHAWKPSPLTRINAALADGREAEAPASVIALVDRARDFSRRSEGLLNPAIGGLVRMWGFHSDERPTGPMPARATIAAWLEAAPRLDDVVIEGTRMRSRNPAVQLDFGAIGEGAAIDEAIAWLRSQGVRHAIINGGGDLRAIGRRGDRPWRIGIRHPQGGGILAALDVEGDESVFTSGNYARFREDEGVRHGHVLDPRTGMPVEGVTSVTVIHRTGLEADAAATALVVAGPEHWHRIAKSMGARHVLLVTEDGTAHMDPGMAARLQFESDRPMTRISPSLD